MNELLRGLFASRRTEQTARSPKSRATAVRRYIEELEGRLVLTAPTLALIGDITLPAGQTFQVPLNGFDADGDTLSFSATSTNSNLTLGVPTGNSSLRIATSIGGTAQSEDIILQLFNDLTPLTAQAITSLVSSGFYTNRVFHRIIPDFVAQFGNDQLGGFPSNLDAIDDEYNSRLTFDGFGQLAMAKVSADDTATGQIFITDVDLSVGNPSKLPPRHLNFDHTIFGQLTDGTQAVANIINVGSQSGTPSSQVVITNMSVFIDRENGVLRVTAPQGFTGTAAITVTASDGQGSDATQTFNVNVIADTQNDKPFLGPVTNQVVNEDGSVTFTVTGTDIDNDAMTFVVRDANNFANSPSNVTVTVAPTGASTSTSRQITLTPAANFNGTVDLLIGVRDQLDHDGDGNADEQLEYDTQQITLTVSAVNDGPLNTAPGAQRTPRDTALTFSTSGGNRIATSDVDAGSVQVTLSATNGTLTLPRTTGLTFSSGDGTADATMTFTGTATNINSALDGLSFASTAGFAGAASVRIATSDQGNTGSGGTLSDTDTVAITVEQDTPVVNDAPVNSVPGSQSMNQGTTLVFSAATSNQISITDPDAGTNPVRVTLTGTNGTITLPSSTGLTFTTGDGTADATMTFTGTITSINTALNGLSFTPAATFTGAASLQISTNDQGNTGTGGALTDSETIDITVVASNRAPVNSVPTAQTTNEDTALVFSAANSNLISISDPDAGTNAVRVTLTAGTNGTVTLSGTTNLTFTAGDGSADATMTFTGTISDINTALAGLRFAPTADFNGTATLQITTNDQGNTGPGGALSDTDTVSITVAAVNDAPVNTVPAAAQTTNEDTAVTFNSTNGNLISIADLDLVTGTSQVQVTLTATHGTITLSGTNNLTFPTGDGTADATMTFRGTITNINTALAGMRFTPDANFNGTGTGAATLRITTSDQGNTGTGGTLTDEDMVTINVTAVNDTPTVSSQVFLVTPGQAQTIRLIVDDGDPELTQTLTFTITAQPAHGTLSAIGQDGSATYTPAAGFTGQDEFKLTVSDGALTSTVATITLRIGQSIGDPSIVIRGGELQIRGGAEDNEIDVSLSADGNSLLVTKDGGPVQTIPLTSVQIIRIRGEEGDDTITIDTEVTTPALIRGGAGDDTITGGGGDDRIRGEAGADNLSGGEGDDRIRGGADNDTIDGEDGNDRIRGEAGADTITGGDGDDRIRGGDDDDDISGDDGDDTIHGGFGSDDLRGGDGNDRIVADPPAPSPFDPNFATLDFGDDTLEGDDGDDRLIGGRGDDSMDGGAGNDRLRGGFGADTLVGSAGLDTLRGGRGIDEYNMENDTESNDILRGWRRRRELRTGNFTDAGLEGQRTDVAGAPDVTDSHHDNTIQDTFYVQNGYSNPPTYGPHRSEAATSGDPEGAPAVTGVYTITLPDFALVHNLEHGHVWISYDPDHTSVEDVERLQRLVRSFGDGFGIVLAPRTANPDAQPIALASWAHLERLTGYDRAAIVDFVLSNRGHAPEGFIPG